MAHDTCSHPATAPSGGHADWRAWTLAAVGVLGLFSAAGSAWADGEGGSLYERVALDGTRSATANGSLRVTQSIGEPMATAGAISPQDAWRGERPDAARQTMFWAQHARTGLGLGFGVEDRGPYSTQGLSQQHQPDQNAGMLVGVSLATSTRSMLTVQTPLTNTQRSAGMPDDPALLGADAQQRQVRVGLVFNSKKPLADLRQGWRTELSGQSSVAVKLRGGRLGFAFQKSW